MLFLKSLPNPNGLLFIPSSPLLLMLPSPPKDDLVVLIPDSDGDTFDVPWLAEFPAASEGLGWFGFISAFKSEKLSDVFILVNDDRLLKLIELLII